MPTNTLEPLDRIIWSADEPDEAALMAKIEKMPALRYIKIDRAFMEGRDFTIFYRLQGRGLQIFDDAKIIEIPSKMEELAKKHVVHKPWMLNCMAGGESSDILEDLDCEKVDGLKRFADVCNIAGVRACGVTVLTSKKQPVIQREFNGRTSQEQVLYYAELLLACNFTDIVCSPEEAKAIRSDARFNHMDLNCPGIRLPGEDAGDQARIDTPHGALASGVTRLVVGRPITVGDSAVNLQKFVDNIASIAA